MQTAGRFVCFNEGYCCRCGSAARAAEKALPDPAMSSRGVVMAGMMWRTAKHEGVGNIVLEQVPIPDVGPTDVLTRTQVSLISRGSELWRRYVYKEALPPSMMGYSTTGIVDQVGQGVTSVAHGDRVVVGAPHAEYSISPMYADKRGSSLPLVRPLHADVSLEDGTFQPLCTSAAAWSESARITSDDRVVILGQGIVGNLVMQFMRRYKPAQLIAVDALDLRLRIAKEVGAPEVVHAGEEDPVAAVQRLTGGAGATIVVDGVGGAAGLKSFSQAQEMLAPGGLLQLIGLYHGEPLGLDASKIMGKRLLGGMLHGTDLAAASALGMAALASGEVSVKPMITHRFSGKQVKEGYDYLYEHPDQAMGVLFEWE